MWRSPNYDRYPNIITTTTSALIPLSHEEPRKLSALPATGLPPFTLPVPVGAVVVVVNGAIISPPKPPPLSLCSAIVCEPKINSPAVLRDTSVPPTVIPGAPGARCEPATSTPVGAAVRAWLARVVMSLVFIVVVVSCGMATREMELGPNDATERGMPEMVRGGDPGVRVTPAS